VLEITLIFSTRENSSSNRSCKGKIENLVLSSYLYEMTSFFHHCSSTGLAASLDVAERSYVELLPGLVRN
jgi:hypothetical protein